MRIISKFHDYYDSVLSYGMDKNLVYVRKTEEIKIKENIFNINENLIFSINNNFDLTIYIIGFCGKIYLCFKLEDKNDLSNIIHAYNIEDLIKFFKKVKNKKFLDYFLNNKDNLNNSKYSIWRRLNLTIVNNLIKKYNSSKKYSELFFKYKVPIFLKKISGFNHGEDRNNLIINPSLKEFEFYKVFDPFTAFQEISMFLGGVLGIGQPELINISNEDMIQKKGFDKKWSFRKLPTKNKEI